jgi:hypothetical protein
MNLIKNSYLVTISFLTFQYCSVFTPTVGTGNTTTTIGTVTIISPNINTSYSYNEISQNIELINKAKTEATKQIDSITNRITKVKENEKLTETQKNNQVEVLNKSKQLLTQKLPVLEETMNAWENIGFNNTEYRQEKDDIDKVFSKLSLEDFKNFLGLTEGDFGGTVIKYYGTPDKTQATLLEYTKGKNVILSFSLGLYSGKIKQMTIAGKNGHDFVNSKAISDKKFKLLGLQKYKIQEYLGNPRAIVQKEDYFEYYSSSIDLYFYFLKNTCTKIVLQWRDIS